MYSSVPDIKPMVTYTVCRIPRTVFSVSEIEMKVCVTFFPNGAFIFSKSGMDV